MNEIKPQTKLTNNKNVYLSKEARKKLLVGVNTVADAVKSTLGPNGKNVIIEQHNQLPHVTKDGVTVARSITLADPLENLGASLVKQAALKANEISGDGTTTTCVLTQALVNKGFEMLEQNPEIRPVELKREMEECGKELSKILREMAKQPDENTVSQVARISSNGDEEVVGLVTQAYQTASPDTVVTVEESSGVTSTVEFTKGFKLKGAGLKSPYFINNHGKETCEMEDALVFINNGEFKVYTDITPVISKAIELDKPLIFVAKGFGQEAQNIINLNVVKGGLNLAFIELKEHGELKENILNDLALLTGGKAYVNALHGNIENINFKEFFGTAKKIEISVSDTTIVEGGGNQERIQTLLSELKKGLEVCSPEQKQDLNERISRLAGSVSVIKVGARTEMEVKEKLDRVEDAINAVKAGLKEGVVSGGGSALIHASMNLKISSRKGQFLVEQSIFEPFIQLCLNYDLPVTSADKILDDLIDSPNNFTGYNFKTEDFENFIDQGIVDPVLVVINALESAISVAGLLLTTEVAMTNERVTV